MAAPARNGTGPPRAAAFLVGGLGAALGETEAAVGGVGSVLGGGTVVGDGGWAACGSSSVPQAAGTVKASSASTRRRPTPRPFPGSTPTPTPRSPAHKIS